MTRKTMILALVLLFAAATASFAGAPVAARDDHDHRQDGDKGHDGQHRSSSSRSSSSSDCPSPAAFEVVQLHSNAMSRDLAANVEIIGIANVSAASNGRNLSVHLETPNDRIGIEVFEIDDATGLCVGFKQNVQDDCFESVTGTTHTEICVLDPPDSGTKSYWAHYTNEQLTDPLRFHTWAEVL